MPLSPQYEWLLCHSPSFGDPFAPLKRIAPIENAQNQQWSPQWNRAGSASFQIRTNNPLASTILDRVQLNDIRGTVRKCIVIKRNGKWMWSGPIWGINGDLDAGTLNISCVGWLEQFQYQIIWQVLDYSNSGLGLPTDQIVTNTINAVNSQDPKHPLLVRFGSARGTMPIRNRYYQRGSMLGPVLQELSDIEAGPDMNVDPVTRDLNLQSWDAYPKRTNVVLGYNCGPGNLKDVVWQEDPTQMINNMYVQSQGQPVGPIFDPVSQDNYGNFSQLVTLTGANQTILEPFAVAELVVKSNPLLTYTLTPHPRMSTEGPTLFDDFDLGDSVMFSAIKDSIEIKRQGVRIFGAQVALDQEGNETIQSLQITPPSGGSAYAPPS